MTISGRSRFSTFATGIHECVRSVSVHPSAQHCSPNKISPFRFRAFAQHCTVIQSASSLSSSSRSYQMSSRHATRYWFKFSHDWVIFRFECCWIHDWALKYNSCWNIKQAQILHLNYISRICGRICTCLTHYHKRLKRVMSGMSFAEIQICRHDYTDLQPIIQK